MIWQFLSLPPDQILGHKKVVEEQEPSCLNKYAALFMVLYQVVNISGEYHFTEKVYGKSKESIED